jgi:hypothetical protein
MRLCWVRGGLLLLPNVASAADDPAAELVPEALRLTRELVFDRAIQKLTIAEGGFVEVALQDGARATRRAERTAGPLPGARRSEPWYRPAAA